MKTFKWGRFSQFVEAGIVNSENIHIAESQAIQFATKTLTPSEGEGRLEYVHAPDFRTIIADCSFHERRGYTMADDGLLRFHFGCDVSIKAWAGEKLLHDVADNPAGVLASRPDEILTEEVPPGEAQRFVTVACRPEWLKRHFNFDISELIGCEGALAGSSTRHYAIRYGRELRRIVQDMIAPPVPSQLRPALLAAKSHEIIIYALSELVEAGKQSAYRLTKADLAAVRRAHDLLQENLISTPDLNGLGRQVGINRTKLSYGFKHLYGMSISQFVTSQRLDHACQLLLRTDLSVSQIAAATGYEHACNFSTAFKSQLGCSPRDFRNGSMNSKQKNGPNARR